MVRIYNPESAPFLLSSDLAVASPLYLYWPDDKSCVYYSTDLPCLLECVSDRGGLKISSEGVSFLLMSGVIPHPKTVYEDIYVLGIGDSAMLRSVGETVNVEFRYDFPFSSDKRAAGCETEPDEDVILELLANGTISKLDDQKSAFLFHSAGKDSNSIALALAEAGVQSRVNLVTHKTDSSKDESEISANIAKKLGFEHRVLHEIEDLSCPSLIGTVREYFAQAPFPCTDGVSLAYPLYASQMPELREADVIDGMGNDAFIGHIPAQDEFRKQKLSSVLSWLRPLSSRADSESLLHALAKTRSEHTGLFGFSFKDASDLFPSCVDPRQRWEFFDHSQDYLDLRAEIRGGMIDQEIFIRKVRNFTDAYGNRLILPWASEEVARYFMSIPEKYLFDRNNLKNKLILRKMLKNRLDLDSDKLGKLGFSYDKSKVIRTNRVWVESEILGCSLWNKRSASRIIDRLYAVLGRPGRQSQVATVLIYRLLLLSLWRNYSRFL